MSEKVFYEIYFHDFNSDFKEKISRFIKFDDCALHTKMFWEICTNLATQVKFITTFPNPFTKSLHINVILQLKIQNRAHQSVYSFCICRYTSGICCCFCILIFFCDLNFLLGIRFRVFKFHEDFFTNAKKKRN